MRALDGAPGVVLRGAVLHLLQRMPADGRGIEQHFGATQRGQASGFRIPLVPANQRGNAPESRIESAEAQVTGSEVKLFEIERVVGDVHLAVDPDERPIGVDHRRGIVIHASRAPLKQRCDDDDLQLTRPVR